MTMAHRLAGLDIVYFLIQITIFTLTHVFDPPIVRLLTEWLFAIEITCKRSILRTGSRNLLGA